MDLGLKGKRAIITGGSRGIGFRTALLLAREGCSIAFCGRNQDDIDNAEKQLKGTKTPNDLFGSGEVPKNSNNVPFLYRSWIETKSDGRQDRIIMIKDTDPDSPSYGEDETVII
mgnify:CR=1 FL=1